MTRKKVNLAYITNDSARKATLKKRKKGLIKKVSELSTLCGVEACAIIYSSYENQPEVWPDVKGAQKVVAQFKRMPEMEQSKKMVNQESFIRQRIAKAAEQLKKLSKENRDKEMTEVMYQCLTGKGSLNNLMLPELNELNWTLDYNLKEIDKKIEDLHKAAPPPPPAMAQPHMAMGPPPAMVAQPQMNMGFTDWLMGNQIHTGFEHGGVGGGGGDQEMMMNNMHFNDMNHQMWTGGHGGFFP